VDFRWFDVRSGRELHINEVPPLSNDNFYATIATPGWAHRFTDSATAHRVTGV
jgi:hypothetical protein